MKLKRFLLQARVQQKYTKGKPLVWRLVSSFDTREEAEAIIPPNRPGEFRILDRERTLTTFNMRFRAVCKEKGLSLTEAAKLCGYSRCMGSYFASGVSLPKDETLERLSKGLDVPMERLTGKGVDR